MTYDHLLRVRLVCIPISFCFLFFVAGRTNLSEPRQNYIYTGWQIQNVVSCFHLTRWVLESKIEQVGIQIALQRSVLLLLWIPNTNTLSTQSARTHQNIIRPKWGMEQQTLKKHDISSVAEHFFFIYMFNLFSMPTLFLFSLFAAASCALPGSPNWQYMIQRYPCWNFSFHNNCTVLHYTTLTGMQLGTQLEIEVRLNICS